MNISSSLGAMVRAIWAITYIPVADKQVSVLTRIQRGIFQIENGQGGVAAAEGISINTVDPDLSTLTLLGCTPTANTTAALAYIGNLTATGFDTVRASTSGDTFVSWQIEEYHG
jgi:hypothetical protein